jgi:nocardicin nonribosomal peptide synthetase NocA
VQLEVCDEQGVAVAAGCPGELRVSGPVVAAGYRDEPGMTAAAFSPVPGATGPATRRYRTRDRVRIDGNGNLVFLGRIDQEVKIRGFRVDPREITVALLGLPGITEAHTVARQDEHGDVQLVAYLAGGPQARLDADRIRQQAAYCLPAHQVPSWVLVVDALPLTASGKVDDSALPPIPAAARGHQVQPDTADVTGVICGLWADALCRHVGPDDNVFDLGAHSLMLAKVRRLLAGILRREIPGVALFEHPTPAALGAFLAGQPPLQPDVPRRDEDNGADRIRRQRARRQATAELTGEQ